VQFQSFSGKIFKPESYVDFHQPGVIGLTNDLEFLPLAISFIRQIAENMGLKNRIFQIELGVEEAATNVIQAGFEPGEKGSFDIIWIHHTWNLRIITRSRYPFDPALIRNIIRRNYRSLSDKRTRNLPEETVY